MEGQWWWQLNPSGGGDGRDEWREVLTLLGISYCVHFCEFMRHCVLPGKSHLWACWSEELLKLALAGYRATGLAGCTPAFTSDVNHSFASLPCAIQKYFVTLLVGSFLKCYFKSPKKGTMEVQAVHPRASRCAIQLWDTIHYCSDRSLLLKIDGGWTPDEGQVHWGWMPTAVLVESPSQRSILFFVSLAEFKNNCERAAWPNCFHRSSPRVFSLFIQHSRPCAYLVMVAWLLMSLHLKLCMVCF